MLEGHKLHEKSQFSALFRLFGGSGRDHDDPVAI